MTSLVFYSVFLPPCYYCIKRWTDGITRVAWGEDGFCKIFRHWHRVILLKR